MHSSSQGIPLYQGITCVTFAQLQCFILQYHTTDHTVSLQCLFEEVNANSEGFHSERAQNLEIQGRSFPVGLLPPSSMQGLFCLFHCKEQSELECSQL